MYFLAFEGLDGAGKSTLIQGLKRALEAQGLSSVITREPGGSALGEAIRELLLTVEGEAPVPRAEALLYQAIRAQHVEKLIRPKLEAKTWVLSDRYAASSIAFQGGGRAIREDDIHWLNRFSTDGLEPHLYVLLDLPVDESLRRLNTRGQDADRFERENRAFHERVRTAYLQLAKSDSQRWLVLNAMENPDSLLKTLLQELKAKKWLN
jgi:dTMP kinase